VPARIPPAYVADEETRLNLYARLVRLRSIEEIDEFAEGGRGPFRRAARRGVLPESWRGWQSDAARWPWRKSTQVRKRLR
jgi:TRCF domain